MGRNTFQSIGKLLPDRINIVISSSIQGDNVYRTFNEAISYLNSLDNVETIFVIGGEQLYKTARVLLFLFVFYQFGFEEQLVFHVCL